MIDSELQRFYAGKQCLVTGGLGFIGSTLAIALCELGAEVTVIDNMLPDHGGNPFNIEPVKDRLTVNFGDILSEHAMAFLVRGKDLVFHLAGQVSHVLSMSNPFPDLEIINVGDDRPGSFLQLAQAMIKVAGEGGWEFAEFTPERLAQEPGDFYSDIGKARRLLGWEPRIPIDEGLSRTFAYYRAHRAHYWT